MSQFVKFRDQEFFIRTKEDVLVRRVNNAIEEIFYMLCKPEKNRGYARVYTKQVADFVVSVLQDQGWKAEARDLENGSFIVEIIWQEVPNEQTA